MKKGLTFTRTGANLRVDGSVKTTPSVADVVAKKRLGEEMIARVDDLPALPSVVNQILTLIEDDTTNASNLERYLRQDQALTARLLRIVNSSFFGVRNKITSIPQAIVMIGYNSLKNLVLAASTSKILEGCFPGYGFKERGLWQHSFMAATWAQTLAKQVGFTAQDSEELFVAGLMHDVGKLVLSSYISLNCKDMITHLIKSNGNIEEAEKNLVGIDHSEIGSRIAQKWNFSSKLSHIIKYHHNVEAACDYQKEVAMVNTVNYCLVQGRFGMYEHFPTNCSMTDACLQLLELDMDKVRQIQEHVNRSAERWEEV
ncbi:MAG: HDOD domain-containing protein [Candidatus Auribacterota bacterium]|jgi:putative nucleotidyltransferase with HDIG domain|nr:HDOD domain-containing protein [Candidatus Auribacterota bacterium]